MGRSSSMLPGRDSRGPMNGRQLFSLAKEVQHSKERSSYQPTLSKQNKLDLHKASPVVKRKNTPMPAMVGLSVLFIAIFLGFWFKGRSPKPLFCPSDAHIPIADCEHLLAPHEVTNAAFSKCKTFKNCLICPSDGHCDDQG